MRAMPFDEAVVAPSDDLLYAAHRVSRACLVGDADSKGADVVAWSSAHASRKPAFIHSQSMYLPHDLHTIITAK